jgi:hypothetical protein
MPEIKPDLSDKSRCISVHWSLPVQCVLSPTHRENWHEAWDPETGNRLRYRRAFGTYATEELRNDKWTALFIPPPGEARQRVDTLLAKLAEVEADRDRARADAKQWHDTYQNEVNARDEFFGDLLKLLPGAEDEGMDAYDQIPRGIENLRADRDRARDAAVALEQENARLTEQMADVEKFVAARAEYITAINNCNPENHHDYWRWQGHAEGRRQLSQTLGLPVGWPAGYDGGEAL